MISMADNGVLQNCIIKSGGHCKLSQSIRLQSHDDGMKLALAATERLFALHFLATHTSTKSFCTEYQTGYLMFMANDLKAKVATLCLWTAP